MSTDNRALADRIADVVEALPVPLIASAISTLEKCGFDDPEGAAARLVQLSPVPRIRSSLLELCAVWRTQHPDTTAGTIALALRTAATAAERARGLQTAELIWTGPSVADVHLRRTDQALLEVIDVARRSLLVVSFAVYRVPSVARALVAAIDRGVVVRICLEAPEQGDEGYDTISALGEEVARRAAIYVWPRANRPQDPAGRVGHLHAKCAVADDQLLFVTSANLTEYALNQNIELGILVRQGPLPQSVAAQFSRLIETGILVRVATA